MADQLRQAAQQALEALDDERYVFQYTHIVDAIAALRKALGQPTVKDSLMVAQPAQWDKPSASFDEWWNGDHDDPANPYEQDSAAYWAWAGWKAAQPEQEPKAQRFTEQQLRDYGSAEFERAVVLAMRATRPFGKTGDVIAVSIAHIKRSEA